MWLVLEDENVRARAGPTIRRPLRVRWQGGELQRLAGLSPDEDVCGRVPRGRLHDLGHVLKLRCEDGLQLEGIPLVRNFMVMKTTDSSDGGPEALDGQESSLDSSDREEAYWQLQAEIREEQDSELRRLTRREAAPMSPMLWQFEPPRAVLEAVPSWTVKASP